MTDGSVSRLWRAPAPLILASRSEGRARALSQAGIPFETRPADVDERAIEAALGAAGPDEIAATLAREKALSVSRALSSRLVVGADQVASCEGRVFGKPADSKAAAELLRFLSGRRHRLHSGVALARDGAIIFETVAHADLTMRSLGDAFLDAYLVAAGDIVTTSAGAYQIEGLGAQLLERVEGDHWTIMGLPLPPLLEALRREGALLT